MKNFEIEKSFYPDLEKSCLDKSRSVINVIKRDDYKIGSLGVQKKIEKNTLEIIDKYNLKNSAIEIDRIKNKILRNALEEISREFGGTLSLYEDLENQYFDLLLQEAQVEIDLKPENFVDFQDVSSLVKKINSKKIIDDKRMGQLIESLDIKNVA